MSIKGYQEDQNNRSEGFKLGKDGKPNSLTRCEPI